MIDDATLAITYQVLDDYSDLPDFVARHVTRMNPYMRRNFERWLNDVLADNPTNAQLERVFKLAWLTR